MPQALAPALGESPLCLRGAGVRRKACNSTLMAVYSFLLQLAAELSLALSAHNECRIVLLSTQLFSAFSLACSGSFSELFLACKGALGASSHDLNGGVCSAAVAHVLEGK